MKFHAYNDPGHGWLKVPMSLLDMLGIRGKITSYSYIRNNFAYLEEDCDATTFITTMKERGLPVELIYHNADKCSRIRNYQRYPYSDNNGD